MEKWKKISLLVLLGFILSGCGKTTVEVTTIAIQKDGTIVHTMVENFGEESVDTLQSMMQEKVDIYNDDNSGTEGSITINTVETDEGMVKVVMTYPDAASFDGFMNMDVVAVDPALRAPFFYGTVEDAYMQGYDMEISLESAEEGDGLQGKNDLLSMGKNKLIIYDNEMNQGAAVQISTQEKPLYISDNVTVAGKNLVEVSETDKLAYILLEG
ncbi:MAG: hypothetical protein HFI11_07135 [Lachnospiraceae bacterium]|jgi:hypothetical protein|nr:hypothetical protein [Lachnospiraceae bacterium]